MPFHSGFYNPIKLQKLNWNIEYDVSSSYKLKKFVSRYSLKVRFKVMSNTVFTKVQRKYIGLTSVDGKVKEIVNLLLASSLSLTNIFYQNPGALSWTKLINDRLNCSAYLMISCIIIIIKALNISLTCLQ